MNIKDLEHLFASDLKSPIFPKLASLYYDNHEFDKASKVCDIGLRNDSNNASGKYIKAKILLIDNKLLEAEKLFKNIIILDENNINALLMLIEVSKSLKRNQTVVNKYINQAYKLFPDNQKIKKMYCAILNNKKNKKDSKIIKKNINRDIININTKMATQTMYKLMVQQKKFNVAQIILEIMKKKKDSNKSFIKRETKKIKTLINKK